MKRRKKPFEANTLRNDTTSLLPSTLLVQEKNRTEINLSESKYQLILQFSLPHKIFLATLLVLMLILSCGHFHGYSISEWRRVIDGSKPKEIVWGESRRIRFDDWMVGIPLLLSQSVHKPPFPRVNTLIGEEGMDTLLLALPGYHPLILFSPQRWGFFINDEFGLAWNWWFQEFGLLYACFLVLMIISRNQFGLSLLTALILVGAPFFQFWALNSAMLTLFIALAFVAAVHVLFVPSRVGIIINSLLCGYCLTGYGLCLYPPFQVTLGYLFLFLFLGFIGRAINEGYKLDQFPLRLSGLGLALIIMVAAGGYFYHETKTAIELMSHTVYPGNRLLTGGQCDLIKLFSNNFIIARQCSINNWPREAIGNICESASIMFFFPALVLKSLWDLKRRCQQPDWLILSLLIYFTLLIFWDFWGFPSWLAKLTMMSRVPEYRSVIGFVLADVFLMVAYLASLVNNYHRKEFPWRESILTCLWIVFMGALSFSLRHRLPTLAWHNLAFLSMISGGFVFCLLIKFRPLTIMMLLAGVTAYSSLWFNPMVNGGIYYLRNNPLSQAIRQFDQQANSQSRWVVFTSEQRDDFEIPNLFRAIGVKCINGLLYYPQFGFWKKLDPEGKIKDSYNRYAHVVFKSFPNQFVIQMPHGDDKVVVYTHPDNQRFLDLNLDYILYVGERDSLIDHSPHWEWIYSYGMNHIYKAKFPSQS